MLYIHVNLKFYLKIKTSKISLMHVIQCSCLKDKIITMLLYIIPQNIIFVHLKQTLFHVMGVHFFYTYKSCIIKCFIKQETSIGQGHWYILQNGVLFTSILISKLLRGLRALRNQQVICTQPQINRSQLCSNALRTFLVEDRKQKRIYTFWFRDVNYPHSRLITSIQQLDLLV